MNRLGLFALLFFLSLRAFPQSPTIEYRLGMSKPWTHLFEVEVTFRNLPEAPSTVDLLMPIWRTGRYIVFDFAGGVQEFLAVDGRNRPLPWTKTDKSTWRIDKRRETVVIARYKVYANEFGMRTRGLNDEHAFVDGSAVFMYIEQYRNLPLKLTVIPYRDWHVTTGLDPVPGERFQFSAPSFDYLVDCPLEIGNQKDFEFEVEGKKHILSIAGQGNYDADTMMVDISKIVKLNKEFWGDLPYERYVFFLHLTSQGGGGTEHINSTIMQSRPFVFKNRSSYRGFLGLVSHEYFHTWNVKQLRPRGILPYDYMKENYVKELWVAEGATSYYGGLLLVRGGFSSVQSYLDGIAASVQGDRQRPGNRIQSLSESSFDAWIKFWKENEQAYNAEADYYDRGSNVSLVLDLEIRRRSKNRYSLDEVMRTLYKRFPLTGSGYTNDDVQKIAEEFAGGSLKEFFESYVDGTAPIDWERYLQYAGLVLQPKESERKPWLGLAASDQAGRTRIYRVIAGSPAAEAGLNVGDEILALNGYRVRSSDLPERIAEYAAGGKVTLTVFRDDTLREFEVTLRPQDIPAYVITKTVTPTKLQKEIFESWLKTTWE
ncbi:MAG: M61 family metallopeptidase [Ignavibacteria bacterium]|nr:M61 family metallopeptidase [Ignavibacteria bacterium]